VVVLRIRRPSVRAGSRCRRAGRGSPRHGPALANHEADVIHAWADAQTGSLRIVGFEIDWRSDERPVEWNREAAIPAPAACPPGEFVTCINRQDQLISASLNTATITTTTGGGGGGSDSCGTVSGDSCSAKRTLE
jgi:hypothetical protein